MGTKSNKSYDTEIVFDFGDDEPLVIQKLIVHSGIETEEMEMLTEIIRLLPEMKELWNSENSDILWMGKPKTNPLNPSEVRLS